MKAVLISIRPKWCEKILSGERRKRKVRMLNKVSGLEVATFESIREAEKHTGIPSSNIVACLKGRQSYTKEYLWCYVQE